MQEQDSGNLNSAVEKSFVTKETATAKTYEFVS